VLRWLGAWFAQATEAPVRWTCSVVREAETGEGREAETASQTASLSSAETGLSFRDGSLVERRVYLCPSMKKPEEQGVVGEACAE
jgi:hypothetical protein